MLPTCPCTRLSPPSAIRHCLGPSLHQPSSHPHLSLYHRSTFLQPYLCYSSQNASTAYIKLTCWLPCGVRHCSPYVNIPRKGGPPPSPLTDPPPRESAKLCATACSLSSIAMAQPPQ